MTYPGRPEDLKNNSPIFSKEAKKVSSPKKGQNIYNFKAQNIYIKPLLKP
jgi:hypothetical protein